MNQHIGKFAYSFDRETFRGDFDTRQLAIAAAVQSAQDLLNPPEAIYVGKRQAIDPAVSGHAETIIERMRRSVFERYGERGADFLSPVNEQQLADLDTQIEKTVLGWLDRQQLGPHFERVAVVTEHPVPTISSRVLTGSGSEVRQVGESADY